MRKIQNKIKALAFYQMVSGVLGILFLLLMNFRVSSTVIITIIGLHSFSIYAGYLLLKRDYEKGLNLSIYNQLIQVISFGIFGFSFQYFSGIFASLGFDITNDTILNYNVGFNTWTLNLSSNSNLFININFVALVLIILIFKWKRETESYISVSGK